MATTTNSKRTAISRKTYSRPVRWLISSGLIGKDSSNTVLDYGCGRGQDVVRLIADGIDAAGYDPQFPEWAEGVTRAADIVNLGYVLNVIDNPAVRVGVLLHAWLLTRKAMLISTICNVPKGAEPCGDGVRTKANTFQKLFRGEQLHQFIQQVLGTRNTLVKVAQNSYLMIREDADEEVQDTLHSGRCE